VINANKRISELELELQRLTVEVYIHRRLFLRSQFREEMERIMAEEREKLVDDEMCPICGDAQRGTCECCEGCGTDCGCCCYCRDDEAKEKLKKKRETDERQAELQMGERQLPK